jgi:hypothetical protein
VHGSRGAVQRARYLPQGRPARGDPATLLLKDRELRREGRVRLGDAARVLDRGDGLLARSRARWSDVGAV